MKKKKENSMTSIYTDKRCCMCIKHFALQLQKLLNARQLEVIDQSNSECKLPIITYLCQTKAKKNHFCLTKHQYVLYSSDKLLYSSPCWVSHVCNITSCKFNFDWLSVSLSSVIPTTLFAIVVVVIVVLRTLLFKLFLTQYINN